MPLPSAPLDLRSDADGTAVAADDRAPAPLPSRDRDTEQRLAELEAVYDAAPVGLCVLDTDLRFVRLNRRFAEINGLPVEAHLGRTPAEVVPDLGEQAEAAMRRVLETGETVELEVSGTTPARPGIVRYWNERWDPIRDGAGEITGISISAEEVTERKAAEEALRESEERYRHLFESMTEGFALHEMVLDDAGRPVDYRILAVNPAFGTVTGLEPDRIVGRLIRELRPGIDPRWIERYGRVARTGEPDRFDEYYPPLGRWFDIYVFSPSPGRFATIVRDVTEQRQAEEALRESERQFRLAMTNAPTVLFAQDRDLRYTWSSNPHEGFSGVDILGKTDFDLLPAEDAAALMALKRQVLKTGVGTRAEVRTTIDGVPYYYDLTLEPLAGDRGEPAGVVGISHEITERKRAEAERAALLEQVRQERDKFEALVNSIPDEVWFLEVGRPAILTNPSAVAGLGIEGAEEVPFDELLSSLEVYNPDGTPRPDEESPMYQALRGEVIAGDEMVRNRRTGELRYRHYHASPVRDSSGEILGSVAVVSDVTEQRAAAERLREYAEDLRRSNEDLERFAYVASHDLQEPLRAIVSFSQLLERRYRGQLGPDADEYIDFIVEGGNRMQTLIQDLLAYSRVNTTRQTITPTDTADVLASVERHLDLSLRAAGAILTHDPMPTVRADPLQLEQVFENLVTNAIKFRRPDEPLHVHVGARRLDGLWEFSVTDNGIGIAEEYFDRIFVIFQRLHTRDAYPGTGIGLAIVKRIIDRHGGTIRVESTPGEGATFFFTLPAACGDR